ncbi:sulfatase-like hydrolase/transferase (plasmid) [Rubrobacter marinus]|uniref:Sulfatase-like hydrolase/transferase n=1 Tax=Rubrobacter marinus TaxID=2653852 RepID=A0A6G8Q3J9_9ACTN|nr:alkaline phosphatase family protein [Rubrobacter marinus]QIN81025.1 sulfatase-like hydrolase/transferase [Rubrobacter marinus]
MLTFLILASLLAAAALALVALEVVRPPERVVNALFVVFSLLVVLLAAWTFALLLGAGSEEGARFGNRVDAAIEILNRRPVDSGGRSVTVPKVPDFLAVYGSDLDRLGHEEGADSPNTGPLLAEMDRQLGRLVRATEDAGIREVTTFLLTSDHGMTTWSRPATEGLAAIARAGYRPEVVLPDRSPSADTEVVVVLNSVRVADVTLLGRAATPKGRERVRAALEDTPHVAQVLDRSDLEELRASDKLGDFVVEAEEPYGFALEAPEGGASRGAHASTRETRVPLVLSRAGVRPGVTPRNPKLVDVAPTVAALLGTRPPNEAQGRALTEVLVDRRGR